MELSCTKTFLDTLLSVLDHQAKTKRLYPKQDGYVTWSELSLSHVTALLQIWKNITHNDYLGYQLDQIQHQRFSQKVLIYGMKQKFKFCNLSSREVEGDKSEICTILLHIMTHWKVSLSERSCENTESSVLVFKSVVVLVVQWVLEQALILALEDVKTGLLCVLFTWVLDVLSTEMMESTLKTFLSKEACLLDLLITVLREIPDEGSETPLNEKSRKLKSFLNSVHTEITCSSRNDTVA